MGPWLRDSWPALRRLLRRYWWVYPAWLVLKWGTLLLLGWLAVEQAPAL